MKVQALDDRKVKMALLWRVQQDALPVHHLLRDTKRGLYMKIHAALKPGGKYIEGDSVIPVEMEGQFLTEYHRQVGQTRYSV